MTLDDILLEAEDKMLKTETAVANEFLGIAAPAKPRPASWKTSGRKFTTPMMRIRELGNISTPEPRMLVITPWDVAALQPIEKAIQKANLDLLAGRSGQAAAPLSFPELRHGAPSGIREAHQENVRGRARGHPPSPARSDRTCSRSMRMTAASPRTEKSRRKKIYRSSRMIISARLTRIWCTRKKKS